MTLTDYYVFDTPDECLVAHCPCCGAMVAAVVNTSAIFREIDKDLEDWTRRGLEIRKAPRVEVIQELIRCHCRRQVSR